MKESKHSYGDTKVVVSKSREQIERLLRAHSVQAVRFTTFPSYAILEFVVQDEDEKLTPYRLRLLPKLATHAKNAGVELNRAERQVWRVAYWWLKSKFEAIDFGLVEFKQEFLPYMLLTNDVGEAGTVAEMLEPRLRGITQHNDLFDGLRKALPEHGKP